MPELYVVPGARGETPAKEDEMVSGMMLTFPLAVMVVVFTFVIVIHWVDSQRKERESYTSRRPCGELPRLQAKAQRRPLNCCGKMNGSRR